jgi:hypothetical protein
VLKGLTFVIAGLAWILTLEGVATAQRLRAFENIPNVRKNGVFHRDFLSLDDNCDPRRGFNVAITGVPANGTVDLQKTSRVLDHNDTSGMTMLVHPSGERTAIGNCVNRTVQMIRMTYRPQADFSGFDKIEYAVTWVSGQTRSDTIYFRVY